MFKVGDSVRFQDRFGEVIEFDTGEEVYKIKCRFRDDIVWFTTDGKYWVDDTKPSLFKIDDVVNKEEILLSIKEMKDIIESTNNKLNKLIKQLEEKIK